MVQQGNREVSSPVRGVLGLLLVCMASSCMVSDNRKAKQRWEASPRNAGSFITIDPDQAADDEHARRVSETGALLRETRIPDVKWERHTFRMVIERLNHTLSSLPKGNTTRIEVPPEVVRKWGHTMERAADLTIHGRDISLYRILSQAVAQWGFRFSVREDSVVIVLPEDYDALPEDAIGYWIDEDSKAQAMLLPYCLPAPMQMSPMKIIPSAPDYMNKEIMLSGTKITWREAVEELERAGGVKVKFQGVLNLGGKPIDWDQPRLDMAHRHCTFHELLRELISYMQELGFPEPPKQKGIWRPHRTVAKLLPGVVEILSVNINHEPDESGL